MGRAVRKIQPFTGGCAGKVIKGCRSIDCGCRAADKDNGPRAAVKCAARETPIAGHIYGMGGLIECAASLAKTGNRDVSGKGDRAAIIGPDR